MIPATSASLPITNPGHPLFHEDCACCRDYYERPVPEVKLASDEEAKRAVQGVRGLYALPHLREIREADYTTKARLAKVSGVSQRQIYSIEHGEHMAREDTALRLANALYVTVADLEGTA